MKSKRLFQLILLTTMLFIVVFPRDSGAQWLPEGTAISTAPGGQSLPQMASDGSNGAIIVWQDFRSGNHHYAQKVDRDGYVQWTMDGVYLGGTIWSALSNIGIVSDGAGGAIVVWRDTRVSLMESDIYAQRIDASGTVLWTAEGVPICTATGGQVAPVILSDGVGGAIIAWSDGRVGFPNDNDIYAQRINSSGVVQWTADGVLVCAANEDQTDPGITEDGSGGAVIGWLDHRVTYFDIYAQRINSSGVPQWAADGVAVCATEGYQYFHGIVTDGSGGGILLWADNLSRIFARRINSAGTPQWAADGVEICSETYRVSPQITADGSGGAIICWDGYGRLPDSWDHQWGVFASKINSSGTELWGTEGIPVFQRGIYGGFVSIQYSQLVTDGYGGAVIAWQEDYYDNPGIYVQRLDAGGNALWNPNAERLTTHIAQRVQLVSNGYQGAVFAWADSRNAGTTGADIYANCMYEFECELTVETLEFGTVVLGDNYLRGFYISNPGGFPLSGSVSESCPDFSIEYTVPPDDPYELEPGEQLQVVVRFEPTVAGAQYCTIETGDITCGDVECTGVGYDCPVGLVYVDADATGSGTGLSWADAFTELRDVLDLTDLCTGIDEIWVAEGTYTPTAGTDRSVSFELVNGIRIYGGFDGTETELSERDVDAHETILSGDLGGVNSYHVVTTGSGINSTAKLDGFTIRDGVADGAADSEQRGGGIYNVEGVPGLNNLIITNNQASLGGGLYSEGGTARLYQCTLQWNTATSTGAGMYNSDGDLFMRNVTFRYNNGGRALFNTSGSGIVRECIFEHNVGGGMYNTSASVPLIMNTVFFENTATNGAGIWNANGSAPQLINVTFYNNTATTSGGAMQNGKFSNPVITNSIFWGNSAPTSPEIDNGLLCIPVVSYSLIEGCGGSGGGWDTALGTDGGNNIDDDPNFKLSHSSDPYLSLWSSSPAINAGTNATTIYTYDLAGNLRIHDTTVDMGAYEHQAWTTTDVDEDLPQVPNAFALYQNSPNPFNPVTTIRFDLPRAEHVRLVVYNVKGELVATLADQNMDAGRKEITWDAKDSAGRTATSGVYFYRLVAGEFVETRKMILLR